MYFGDFLTNGWESINYAKGGRDSYGGYSELWATAKKNVEAGDYVIITFAHNDEKNGGMDGYQLRDYYLSIGDQAKASAVDLRGSIPSTTYKQNLSKIVDEVKAMGAIPIICSPVCRAYFTGNTIRRNGRHDLGDSYSELTANGPVEGKSVPANDHLMDYAYHSQKLAEEKNVDILYLETGDTITGSRNKSLNLFSKEEYSFIVVSPDSKEDYHDSNAASLTLLYQEGDYSYAFMGDAELQAESAMLEAWNKYGDGCLEFLKCAHHGSANNTNTEVFIKALKPKYAIISCGKNNRYGHPHKETLEYLEETGAVIRRTDELGAIECE